jgi:hypothetical protein
MEHSEILKYVLDRLRSSVYRYHPLADGVSYFNRVEPQYYLNGNDMAKNKRRAKKPRADRRRRKMLLPTKRGTKRVVVSGSRTASQLGKYMAAVGVFLRSGDTEALEQFAGESIAGHRLITDPETLSSLAQAGALQLDTIYAVESSS